MKQVLIIGAGAQGHVIAGILAGAEDVAGVHLVDLDLDRAEEAVRVLESDKLEAGHLDASDPVSVAAVLADRRFDLVVNATLTRLVRPILEACTEATCDYLDMASNELLEPSTEETVQDPFIVEQFEYDAAFRESGRRALINAGGDAGLVNIMARDAADELDEIDYIGIKDYGIVDADEPVALWSLETYLEDCFEAAIYWEDGRYKYAPPFSGAEDYYFPPPLDRTGTVYYHCHEEPLTIPRFIGKPVKYCDFKLGDPASESWQFVIEGLGLMDEEPVEAGGVMVRPRDLLFARIPKTLSPEQCIRMVGEGRIMSRLQLAVDVEGTREGRRRHYKMWTDSPSIVEACERIPGANDVSWITSVPASILCLMLLRGQIEHIGVFPCEVLGREEREVFFAGIRDWGVKVHRQVTTDI